MGPNRTSQTLAAFETLYDDCGEAIYRYVLGMLGRRQDAEDAAQTIWLKLAQTQLGEIRDLRAYLWTAARRHVATLWRRRRRERRRFADSEEPEMLAAEENPDVHPEELRDMECAILTLAPKFREMVVLVGLQGFTLKEASASLGIPAGTAASRYRAALAKLRRRLRRKVTP